MRRHTLVYIAILYFTLFIFQSYLIAQPEKTTTKKEDKQSDFMKGVLESQKQSLTEESEADKTLEADDDYITTFYLETIIILIILSGIGYLIYRFVKSKRNIGSESKLVKKIATHPIAPNKFLQVIELGSKVYVLGIGDDVTLLCEIKDKEEIDLIKLLAGEQSGSGKFFDSFTNFIDRFKTKKEDVSSEQAERKHVEFLEEKREKLKKMQSDMD